MKQIPMIAGAMAVVIAAAALACNSSDSPSKKSEGLTGTTISQDSLIRRGEYLVSIMDCNACHTPLKMGAKGPEPDLARMLSGHPENVPLAPIDKQQSQNWVLFSMTSTAMVGPWGVSFAGNITSDETGIGNWTEAQFFKAIREGKYKGMDNTRMLLPPMPWPQYGKASDDDLRAIFAYLKSVPPVENRVPAAIPPDQLGKL